MTSATKPRWEFRTTPDRPSHLLLVVRAKLPWIVRSSRDLNLRSAFRFFFRTARAVVVNKVCLDLRPVKRLQVRTTFSSKGSHPLTAYHPRLTNRGWTKVDDPQACHSVVSTARAPTGSAVVAALQRKDLLNAGANRLEAASLAHFVSTDAEVKPKGTSPRLRRLRRPVRTH